MSIIKKILSILLCVTMVLCFVSCEETKPESSSVAQTTPTPTTTPEKSVHVGVSLHDFDDNYFSFFKDTVETIAEGDTTVTVDIYDAAGDSNTQISQINALITSGAAALAVSLVDTSAVRAVCDLALQSQLPLVFVGQAPDFAVLSEYENVWYIGTDSESEGRAQAEMIHEHFESGTLTDKNSDGIIQAIMITGEENSPIASARTTGFTKYFETANVKVEILASESANWSAETAKEVATRLFSENPGTEVIVANSDGMALGAVQALEASDVFVYGIDAVPEAIEAIKNGTLDGTVYDNPDVLAQVATTVLTNSVREKDTYDGIVGSATYSANTVMLAPQQVF